jgi:hypothetical protein
MTLEQRDAHFALERAYPRSDVRLDRVQFRRRPIHTAVPGNGFKHLEVGNVHALHLHQVNVNRAKPASLNMLAMRHM